MIFSFDGNIGGKMRSVVKPEHPLAELMLRGFIQLLILSKRR